MGQRVKPLFHSWFVLTIDMLGILGIPMDLGANVQGSREGPDKIRQYLLPLLKQKGIAYEDFGNVPVYDDHRETDPTRKNYGEIEHTCVNFSGYKDFITSGFPLVLGGDHSVSICFVKSLSQKLRTGLIYFDAHGDFNTPTISPSGNIHGMVVSEITSGFQGNVLRLVCDYCERVHESNVVLVGTRDLDAKETRALMNSEVTVFSRSTIRELGIETVMKRAIKIVSTGTDQIHLSFDLDVVDPSITPGVSTPVPDGLGKVEVFRAIASLQRLVTSMDIVEYIPQRDPDGRTGRFAAELVSRIL